LDRGQVRLEDELGHGDCPTWRGKCNDDPIYVALATTKVVVISIKYDRDNSAIFVLRIDLEYLIASHAPGIPHSMQTRIIHPT